MGALLITGLMAATMALSSTDHRAATDIEASLQSILAATSQSDLTQTSPLPTNELTEAEEGDLGESMDVESARMEQPSNDEQGDLGESMDVKGSDATQNQPAEVIGPAASPVDDDDAAREPGEDSKTYSSETVVDNHFWDAPDWSAKD